MPRDDFSARVVSALRTRVAHRCSNPECRAPTVGPGDGPHAVASIGKAAHIAAASPGGPRYIAEMTREQRSSIDNGIWLCSNCATKIDVSPDAYPIRLLREWKQQAERTAHEEKGRNLPCADDARNQLVSVMGGMPASFVPSAIQNTHEASELVLQAIDPRFRIETSYRNRTTTYKIEALQPVPAELHVPTTLRNELQKAMQDLFEHGRDVSLPSEGIYLKGSPLFERILPTGGLVAGTFHIQGEKKSAMLKIKATDSRTGLFQQFDDVFGSVSFGAKSLTFDGHACDGLLQISWNVQHSPKADKSDITLSADTAIWGRKDVRYLPHFDKLLDLFKAIENGWDIEAGLEIQGLNLLRAIQKIPEDANFIKWMNAVLRYIELIRKIARHFGVVIRFSSESEISEDDFSRAMEVVEIIEGRYQFDKSALKSNVTCKIIAQDNARNIHELIKSKSSSVLVFYPDDRDGLSAFGQAIQLPMREVTLEGVRAEFDHVKIAEIKDGDVVSVEWIPDENFRYTVRYLAVKEELD